MATFAKRQLGRVGVALGVAAMLGCPAFASSSPSVAPAPVGSVASAGPDGAPPDLDDVVGLSPSDAWVSGDIHLGRVSLLQHWNGTSWVGVPVPKIASHAPISPIAALSDDDVWAVGTLVRPGADGFPAIVEHWDGSAWTRTALPGSVAHTFLWDAYAGTPSDVWLVGYHRPPDSRHPTAVSYRWDGTVWTKVPVPQPAGYGISLYGVAGQAPDDVWAVGSIHRNGAVGGLETYVMHWDGSAWHRIRAQNPGTDENYFTSVTETAAGDVWALGETAGQHGQPRPLVEQYQHGVWHTVTLPRPYRGSRYALTAISGDQPNDVWAVGFKGGTDFATVALHWNGTTWQQTPTPNPAGNAYLTAVTAGGPGNTWAVGDIQTSHHLPPLRLQWNGHRWIPR